MRIRSMVTFAALCLTAAAVAQDEPAQNRPEPPQIRRGADRRGGQPHGRMFDRIGRRLTETLELDQEQQAELQEIVAEFGEEMAAREPGSGRPSELMNEFFTEVETILDGEQVGKLGEVRERMSRSWRGGQRRHRLRRLIGELPQKLALDEQQQGQYDELVAQLRKQRDAHRARMQDLRPLFEEMHQAMRDGDEQRAAELREQLRPERPEGGSPFEAFFSELEKILRDDQKAILAALVPQRDRRAGPGKPADVRTLLQAVKRLHLDEQQRKEVKRIGQEAMRAARELKRGDRGREARAELAKDVKQQIVALLRPEQVEQFERILKGQRPRGGKDGPKDRPGHRGGERRGPPDKPQP